jgi:hypothetical protein
MNFLFYFIYYFVHLISVLEYTNIHKTTRQTNNKICVFSHPSTILFGIGYSPESFLLYFFITYIC